MGRMHLLFILGSMRRREITNCFDAHFELHFTQVNLRMLRYQLRRSLVCNPCRKRLFLFNSGNLVSQQSHDNHIYLLNLLIMEHDCCMYKTSGVEVMGRIII